MIPLGHSGNSPSKSFIDILDDSLICQSCTGLKDSHAFQDCSENELDKFGESTLSEAKMRSYGHKNCGVFLLALN